ncbi:MAG TPA: hypothetical protein PLT76_04850 [Candidatus Omnitrophota bacterium]|nr:hypothetical protein [Candidatus Omnitrophota bacterium]HPB67505.1 hypothetical protein [Candidatus Omnitrophota bacterium]HQO58029.1 hypothetical protein [Candidatus Omnitrophota bacterium]HQP11209.1 hypothetical protein [Candidatus Omnitrophota bacterium]
MNGIKGDKEIPPHTLRAFSGEHLWYEIHMLYGVMDILLKGVDDDYLYNALLEAFVLHASVILDFFYKPAVKPDDARAVHYVRDAAAFYKALPPFEQKFGGFTRKRNKEVVHLSYRRLYVRPEEKHWRSPKITKDIRRIVDLFLDHADPVRLHPKMYTLRTKA